MRRILTTFSLAAGLTSLATGSVAAQDRGNPDWHFVVAPYLWFSNLNGAQTLGIPHDHQDKRLLPLGDTDRPLSHATTAQISPVTSPATLSLMNTSFGAGIASPSVS